MVDCSKKTPPTGGNSSLMDVNGSKFNLMPSFFFLLENEKKKDVKGVFVLPTLLISLTVDLVTKLKRERYNISSY